MRVYLGSRRQFFSAVAAFFASMSPLVKVGPLLHKSSATDDEFVIINGWVLKREDFASGEVERDALRF
jgi:hypothetical protein